MGKNFLFCKCGKGFRTHIAESKHRHNFPLLCNQLKPKTKKEKTNSVYRQREVSVMTDEKIYYAEKVLNTWQQIKSCRAMALVRLKKGDLKGYKYWKANARAALIMLRFFARSFDTKYGLNYTRTVSYLSAK